MTAVQRCGPWQWTDGPPAVAGLALTAAVAAAVAVKNGLPVEVPLAVTDVAPVVADADAVVKDGQLVEAGLAVTDAAVPVAAAAAVRQGCLRRRTIAGWHCPRVAAGSLSLRRLSARRLPLSLCRKQ